MKSETVTKLSLPRFAEILGINPLHIMGVQLDSIQNATCDTAWFQYEWQTSDRVSREEVTRAIAQAEADIEGLLHYRLLPSWEIAERHETIRPRVPEQVYFGHSDVRGFPPAVETDWKYVISGGIRAQTLIGAAAVSYANSGIGPAEWLDTATATIAVDAGTDPCQIAVYMPGANGDERYRIRPVQVTIAGALATITFRRELGVIAALQEEIGTGGDYIRPIDGLDDAKFIDEIDVYRVYNSGAQQASMIWFPPNGGGCATCGGAGCLSCQEAAQTACLSIRNPRMGQVGYIPAAWNAETGQFDTALRAVGRAPDALALYYYAGWRDRSRACPLTEMNPDWERTVAILATSRLSRALCACATAKAFGDYYQRNAAFRPGDGSGFTIDINDLGNPLGTKIGEIYAWKRIAGDTARVPVTA